MRRTMSVLMMTAVASLITLPAAAADSGFYLGASVGQSEISSGDLGDAEIQGNDLGFKVFGGYRLLTFLAVEGSYVDLGGVEDEDAAAQTRYTADVTGFDLYAVGYLPLGIADVFAKVGMIDWDAEIEASLPDAHVSASDSGTDPAYGLGVQFRVKSFAIRAEVEYFDVESANHVYMYSAGVSYTF